MTLSFAVSAADASLFGRDKIVSRWAAKPPAVDGDDVEWDPATALEDDGLSFQAMNDDKDLYLVITAHTREGREQLAGESKQNISWWFIGADGKTRDWGAVLPYSRRSPLTNNLRDGSSVDPEPELVWWTGAGVSTATWPSEVPDRFSLSGRRPVWELKVPLNRLKIGPKRTVNADFAVGAAGATATAKTRPDPVTLFLSIRLAEPPETGR